MKKFLYISLVLTLLMMFAVSGTALAQSPDPTEEARSTEEPTAEPTAELTEEPTAEPTEEPTAEPTEEPTAEPTEEPTAEPTVEPTAEPSVTTDGQLGSAGEIGAQASVDSTTVKIMNIGTAAAPDTVINWYNPDGSLATGCGSGTTVSINQYGTAVVAPSCASSGFRGSAVVQSSQSLVAISENLSGSGSTWSNVVSAVSGRSTGATTQMLPGILANGNDTRWSAVIAVQNVGANPTTVDMTFFTPTATSHSILGQTIQPNASYFINTKDLVTGGNLPNSWVGTFRAESTDGGSLYAVAILTQEDGRNSGGYEAFGPNDGDTTVYASTVQRFTNPASCTTCYNGWQATISVQNLDTINTNQIQFEFLNSDGSVVPGATVVQTAQPGAPVYLRTPDVPALGTGFAGGARISSLDGRDIVAVVNSWENKTTTNGGIGKMTSYSSYTAQPVANAGTVVYGPNVVKNPGGWNTTLVVQNLESGNANVEATIYDTDGNPVGSTIDVYAFGTSNPDIGEGGIGAIRVVDVAAVPSAFVGGVRFESTSGHRIAVSLNYFHASYKNSVDAYYGVNGIPE